jgi:hypothetical protein
MSVSYHYLPFLQFILLLAVSYLFMWVLLLVAKVKAKSLFLGDSSSSDSLPYPEVEKAKIKVDLSKKDGFSSNYDRLPDFDDLGVYPPKISSDLDEEDLTNYGGY